MKIITPEAHASQRIDINPAIHRSHVQPISAPLHVVAVISNPSRFRTRYELFRNFEKYVTDSGAILTTVELALRDRHFEVTTPGPRTVQVRSPDQLWHKENLINIGIRALPADWEYVAWIDADVTFSRPDWVYETLHQLQSYKVVQLFSHAQDLGPNGEPIQQFQSFCYSHRMGFPFPRIVNSKRGKYTAGGHQWHPGYAWAARRSALSDVGLLGDIGILGSGDHHMACAFIDRVRQSIHGDMSYPYSRYWQRWQQRAIESVRLDIGYVPGLLLHYWHGAKRDRKYVDRWQILTRNKFDPTEDIIRDAQGLWQLAGNKPQLRDDIRDYFNQRNEDGIDV